MLLMARREAGRDRLHGRVCTAGRAPGLRWRGAWCVLHALNVTYCSSMTSYASVLLLHVTKKSQLVSQKPGS